jgi:hypothetical protein
MCLLLWERKTDCFAFAEAIAKQSVLLLSAKKEGRQCNCHPNVSICASVYYRGLRILSGFEFAFTNDAA